MDGNLNGPPSRAAGHMRGVATPDAIIGRYRPRLRRADHEIAGAPGRWLNIETEAGLGGVLLDDDVIAMLAVTSRRRVTGNGKPKEADIGVHRSAEERRPCPSGVVARHVDIGSAGRGRG